MTGHYSSFLIRRWSLASGTQRISVEHIQSGEQVFVPTLDAATAWIGAWSGDAGLTNAPPAVGTAAGTAPFRQDDE